MSRRLPARLGRRAGRWAGTGDHDALAEGEPGAAYGPDRDRQRLDERGLLGGQAAHGMNVGYGYDHGLAQRAVSGRGPETSTVRAQVVPPAAA